MTVASPVPSLGSIPGASRWRDPRPSPLLRLLGIRTDDPRFARLKQALWQGDPLADAVADWVQSTRGGWALFQQALVFAPREKPARPDKHQPGHEQQAASVSKIVGTGVADFGLGSQLEQVCALGQRGGGHRKSCWALPREQGH